MILSIATVFSYKFCFISLSKCMKYNDRINENIHQSKFKWKKEKKMMGIKIKMKENTFFFFLFKNKRRKAHRRFRFNRKYYKHYARTRKSKHKRPIKFLIKKVFFFFLFSNLLFFVHDLVQDINISSNATPTVTDINSATEQLVIGMLSSFFFFK